MQIKSGGVEVDLKWLGHSGFLIKNNKTGKNIYIDPYRLSGGGEGEDLENADVILITHSHYDHCSIEDLRKIVKHGTVIVATPDSQSKLVKFERDIHIKIIEPNQE